MLGVFSFFFLCVCVCVCVCVGVHLLDSEGCWNTGDNVSRVLAGQLQCKVGHARASSIKPRRQFSFLLALRFLFESQWHKPRWSMGCVMYEMFANVLPFHLSGSMADADAHQALQFSCEGQLLTHLSGRMRGSSCTSRARSGTSSDKFSEHLEPACCS